MPVQITPPTQNDDCRELWRKVAECIGVINAIGNMQVTVEGRVHMTGKLEVSGDSSTLEIKEPKEING